MRIIPTTCHSILKFALTDDGMAMSVRPAQEDNWRIGDFVTKNKGGGDGTYEKSHLVYIKSVEVMNVDEERVD